MTLQNSHHRMQANTAMSRNLRRMYASPLTYSQPESVALKWYADMQDMSLMVRQQPGFLCRLQLQAKIPMAPDKVYDLLVAPENSRWFSSIKVHVAFLCVRGCLIVQHP